MRTKKVSCHCSVCPCTIKALPKDLDPFSQLCAMCRNDIHSDKSAMIKLGKVKKILDAWYEERYETNWDDMAETIIKVRRIVNKK